jgi:hypothetical protein
VTGRFILISKGTLGVNLWKGTYERGISAAHTRVDVEEAKVEARANTSDDRAGDSLYLGLVSRRLTQAPGEVLAIWISRIPWLWIFPRTDFFFRVSLLSYGSPGWLIAKAILFLLNLTVCVVALIGIFLARRDATLRWFLLPIIYTAVVLLPFHIEVRYSQPVYDFVLVFAGVTLTRWLGRDDGIFQADIPLRPSRWS